MAGDKRKRINWDGAASETIPDAPQIATLRDWAARQIASGESMAEIAKRIGCSWGTLQGALKKAPAQAAKPTRKSTSGSCEEETQPKPEPQVLGTCWNCDKPFPEDDMREHDGDLYCPDCYRELCGKSEELGTCWSCGGKFPADTMHPDGDTLECPDCYRKAHESEAPAGVAVDGACDAEKPVGNSTAETPGPPVIRAPMDVTAEALGFANAILGDLADGHERTSAPLVADGVTRETTLGSATIDACKAYLRYLGLGEAEVNVLPVFLAGYLARGDAA